VPIDEFEKRKREVLAPVYFEAGAALFDCQSFEYGIAYLLSLLSRAGIIGLEPERCAAILDNEEKKTAGQLIQLLRKHVQISANVEEGLVKALEARNRLMHRYLVENAERLLDVREHDTIIREIRALRSDVRNCSKQLAPSVKSLARGLDHIDPDKFAEEAKRTFLEATREH
jgi:hypothetical protein